MMAYSFLNLNEYERRTLPLHGILHSFESRKSDEKILLQEFSHDFLMVTRISSEEQQGSVDVTLLLWEFKQKRSSAGND
jgi:hypothetical protein